MKKMKYLMTTVGLCFLIVCCSKKDEINSLEKTISFDQVKLSLASFKDQNKALTAIANGSNVTQLMFEDGTSIGIDNNMIDHIDTDSANWLKTFFFNDGTSVSTFFIGKLNLTNDNISVDPYEKNPLTALAKIQTPIKGIFKIIVHGKGTNGVAISKTFSDYTYSHEIPILGLYQNYNNQVEFIFMNQNGSVRTSKIISIQTEPIPNSPSIDININTLGGDYNGIYLITNLRLGFDQMGEVRWCYTPESHNQLSFLHKLNNGNVLAVSPDGTVITEQTMIGQSVKSYTVPNGIHHDIIELPTGNLMVTSNSNNGLSVEDLIVEIDRASGSIVKSWNLYTLLDPSRKALPDSGQPDWFHMNSLFYDATDKSIIVSGRNQSAVVKIDYNTGTLKWILGNPNFWNAPFTSILLNAINSTGQPLDVSSQDFWPYGQHAAQRLPNGNIQLYDDGDFRGFYDNQSVPQVSYSRAVEYAIDEQAKTIKLVWEFDYNKSQFTPYTGYVQQLLNNNRVIAYMDGAFNGATGPKIVEINSDNQILFDADINHGAPYYRGWKVDLYQGID